MFLVAAPAHELLRLRGDQVKRPFPVRRGAQRVMDLTPAIQAQHNIVHFAVDEVDLFIVKRHAVRSDCEIDALVVSLFEFTAVSDGLFHHIPVQKRLAAEKVHLKVVAFSGMGNEKIERRVSDLLRHQHPRAVKLARVRKAVSAAQVAVVRHVHAHRLHDLPTRALRRGKLLRLERTRVMQRIELRHDLVDLRPGVRQAFERAPFFERAHHFVRLLVHAVYGAAFYVKRQVILLKSKCVNQVFLLNNTKRPPEPWKRRAGFSAHGHSVFRATSLYLPLVNRQRQNRLICSPSGTSGSRPCRRSCRRTGRMPGTRHNRCARKR